MKRIYHTWDKWECYPAGFYNDKPAFEATKEELESLYASFLSDSEAFASAARRVLKEWPNSCEHYLSNENMNRIAWIGQSSACIQLGIPACYRGGFHKLTDEQQKQANSVALTVLNEWLASRGEPALSEAEAESKTEMNLY